MRSCAVIGSIIIVIFFGIRSSTAQYDPYKLLTDPLAICRINTDELFPLKYAWGVGYSWRTDPTSGYSIIASDTGSGILTHFWTTIEVRYKGPMGIRIIVDDSVVVDTQYEDFFRQSHGLFRPPLHTQPPGANMSDIQIPYKRNFRITVERAPTIFWFAAGWRPLPPSYITQRFDPMRPDPILAQQQQAAEEVLANTGSPWGVRDHSAKRNIAFVPPRTAMDVFTVNRGGILQKIHLQLSAQAKLSIDSIRMDIYWDDCPTPSISAPISEFFISQNDTTVIHSYPIRAQKDSGLICYFPMPFRKGMRMQFVNTASRTAAIDARIEYIEKDIDINTYGYFFTALSETKKTRYGVWHPVANILGQGRLVGSALYLHNLNSPVALEGDTHFDVDSTEANIVHYVGTEDYFGGGFYFLYQIFTSLFCGHVQFLERMYRFHYMDAIEFKKSLQFKWQHGVDNDVSEHYRTIAYYYKKWTPFWVTRDTIRVNERWSIAGSGYEPGEQIDIYLDYERIAVDTADAGGSFTYDMTIPSSWAAGMYRLRVNTITRPEPIVVLSEPVIYPVADFLPPVLNAFDSLTVRGNGFIAGEGLTFYLDNIRITDSNVYRVKDDYSFEAVVRMPHIADRPYKLSVIGSVSGRITSLTDVVMTRRLAYEFEDLVEKAYWSKGYLNPLNLGAYWHAKWSRQGMALYEPIEAGDTVIFPFYLPVSDSFQVQLKLTTGASYGNFSYFLDGIKMGEFKGYQFFKELEYADNMPTDTIQLSVEPLKSGMHYWTFVCTGKEDSSSNYKLGADAFFLIPTTVMPLEPGTITGTVRNTMLPPPEIIIYPNPADGSGISLVIKTLSEDSGSKYIVEIVDPSGKIHRQFRSVVQNTQETIALETNDLPSGSYTVRLRIYHGSEFREISRLLMVTK